MRAVRLASIFFLLGGLATACAASSTPGGGTDAGPQDAATADTGVPDGSQTDGGTTDADVPDASSPTCLDLSCGANATCSDASGTATCSCDATYQDNDGDGDCSPQCDGATCSGHGACVDTTGTAVCTCTGGYEGPACEACGTGLQDNDVDGMCAPICTASTCSGRGSCSDTSGTAVCTCAGGYTGSDCSSCGAGLQDRDGDGVCLAACDANLCNGHGVCDDVTGVALCTCMGGYEGTTCATCAAGTQDNDGDGACTADCTNVVCGSNAVCSDATGTATCGCASGYRDDDGDGNCSATCAVVCTSNGSCSDTTGTVICDCDAGYQDNDNNASCTPTCSNFTCGSNTSCDDASGTATCSCVGGTSDEDGDGNCSPACSVYGGSASAGPGTPGDNPWNAFDGNFNSQFNGITSSVSYLQYDYGASASPTIVSYTLYSYGYSASEVFGFQLLGSPDGIIWTTLDVRNTTLPIGAPPKRFSFANSTGYRYYRLDFFNTAGGFVRVQELQLNSCP